MHVDPLDAGLATAAIVTLGAIGAYLRHRMALERRLAEQQRQLPPNGCAAKHEALLRLVESRMSKLEAGQGRVEQDIREQEQAMGEHLRRADEGFERLSAVEADARSHAQRDADHREEVRARFDRLEAKLDRLLERHA